jgi:hypothetical protein
LRASWAFAIQKGGAEVQKKMQAAKRFAKAVKMIGKVRISYCFVHATFLLCTKTKKQDFTHINTLQCLKI